MLGGLYLRECLLLCILASLMPKTELMKQMFLLIVTYHDIVTRLQFFGLFSIEDAEDLGTSHS